ncbi:MAG: acyl-CoA-binding protein [Chloroflexota bacterium]|nr:MAG: acyl-CoA-binding protein [Chloroflexota bacterium]
MPDLETKFRTAADESRQLSSRPDNDTLLRLYAFYKQATAGDISGKRPGMMDMVGRAKYDAWAGLQGTSKEAAMQSYIELVERLKNS